jgi:hypothetical protein
MVLVMVLVMVLLMVLLIMAGAGIGSIMGMVVYPAGSGSMVVYPAGAGPWAAAAAARHSTKTHFAVIMERDAIEQVFEVR